MRRLKKVSKRKYKWFKSIILPENHIGAYYGNRVPIYGRDTKLTKVKVKDKIKP